MLQVGNTVAICDTFSGTVIACSLYPLIPPAFVYTCFTGVALHINWVNPSNSG